MATSFEISHLFWLDAFINSKDHVNTQYKLRPLMDDFKIFDDIIKCEKCIQSISLEDRITLIISGDFSQELIPLIHDYEQIYSIYIYCLNKQFYEQWSAQYSKVKGVYNELNELIDQIGGNRRRRRRRREDIGPEPLSMSIYNTNVTIERSTSGLDGRFVHSQLLIDCLLRMPPQPMEKDEFISLYSEQCQKDKCKLKDIDDFKQTYSNETAISWYTKDAFLYRVLNNSLRTENIDLLFGLRFVIRDIEQHLKKHQCLEPVRLYRGQFIDEEEMNILKQSKGKLISVNSFLSTTKDVEVAKEFIVKPDKNNPTKLKPVLFIIKADPCQSGIKPFADIESESHFDVEQEILMMLGTVFRLDKIYIDQDDIWIMEMTLCSDNDHDLNSVFDHMRNQYGAEQTRLLLFGHVLVDMGHFDDAEKYYKRLLNELKMNENDLVDNHKDIADCYHSLGKVACEKGDYKSGLRYLRKSMEMQEKRLNRDHPRMGFIHTNIGEVYQRKGDYDQALKSYEKALAIWKEVYTDDHESISWCFNNIAIIYCAQKKYVEALDYHLKALNIKRALPPQHPCLGNTYLNMGNVYFHLGQYDEALKNYQLSHEIYRISLTPEHPSIACVIKNIGIVHEAQGDYSKALEYYRKASSIRQESFHATHPDSIQIDKDIKRVLLKIKIFQQNTEQQSSILTYDPIR